VLVAGCAGPKPDQDRAAATSDDAFHQLADEYLAGYLAWRPAQGVSLGLHEYDGKITDYRRASLDAELARLKDFDRRLARLNTQTLSPRAFYDYRILRAAIRKELFDFEELQVFSRNPMTYASALDVNIYLKRNFAPLDQRVRSIIAVLGETSNIVAAARANLAESVPKPYVETAIQVAEGSVDFLSKDLVTALRGLTNEALRSPLTTATDRASAALRGYVQYLKEQKLPKANQRFALGRDRFARMLRETELITLPPEQILEIGLVELVRQQKAFALTAKMIDPTRQPIDVFKDIQKDHPTEESLIPDTKKNLEALRQFVIDRHVVTIPSEVRPRVEDTPQYARATSFASMDTPGPFETNATEAYYYVTPVEKDWSARQKEQWLTAFNYYTTDVVSIHEAWPGHYLQNLCLNASPATRLEKILSSYAFVEGWAHYTEQMMLDEGFGLSASSAPSPADLVRAAKYRLAQIDEALLRLCRLCVAIKMHCAGMTVEEATRFFQEHCYYEEKPARQEAVRGTYDPGYLHYTLGKLMILKLREDYQAQEGAGYSLKQFHDEILRHGMPPIPLLRELILKDRRLWKEIL
jgi:uncharacterized protein (DUF885 family)